MTDQQLLAAKGTGRREEGDRCWTRRTLGVRYIKGDVTLGLDDADGCVWLAGRQAGRHVHTRAHTKPHPVICRGRDPTSQPPVVKNKTREVNIIRVSTTASGEFKTTQM